jgi:hypothetical protein
MLIYRLRFLVICLVAALSLTALAQAEYNTLVLQRRHRVGWGKKN